MASANEKKRRRPLSSPGMSSALECLTALISRFPEVAHWIRLPANADQQFAECTGVQSAQVEPGIVVQPWNCPCVYGYRAREYY